MGPQVLAVANLCVCDVDSGDIGDATVAYKPSRSGPPGAGCSLWALPKMVTPLVKARPAAESVEIDCTPLTRAMCASFAAAQHKIVKKRLKPFLRNQSDLKLALGVRQASRGWLASSGLCRPLGFGAVIQWAASAATPGCHRLPSVAAVLLLCRGGSWPLCACREGDCLHRWRAWHGPP